MRTPDGRRHTVRRSITPGWSYDVLTPCVHWRADEWVLTRTRAVHLSGEGSALPVWRGVHALNDEALYAACEAAFEE